MFTRLTQETALKMDLLLLNALVLTAIMLAALVGPASVQADDALGTAEVARPIGDYAIAILTIDELPVWPAHWPMFVPFRDGVGTVSHPVGITHDGGRLERKGDRITGTFEVSLPPNERNGPTLHTQAMVELTVADSRISGTCTVGEVSHEVTGTWRAEAELAAANKLDSEAAWPMWIGPTGGGTCATSTDVQLVNSLADAQLVWRSEEAIGNNMGSINRFMGNLNSSTRIRTSGQSASPVYGQGMIFLHQRVPAGTEYDLKVGHSGTTIEEIKAAGFEELPWYAMEKHLLKASEQVIAIDAQTGKTLWISTLPIGSPNVQHHKDRGGDRTPAYADGKLLGLSYHGELFCLDAKSGELLWQNESQGRSFNPALAVAGSVVMAPVRLEDKKGHGVTWGAHDIVTGKLLWRAPQRYSSSSVAIFDRKGKQFVLVPTSDKELSSGSVENPITLHCLEAATGKTVWSMPFLMGSNRLGIASTEDLMITFERTPEDNSEDGQEDKYIAGLVCGYRLSDDKAERLWAVEHDLPHYAQPMVMHGGRYVVAIGSGYSESNTLHKVIDAKTGKVISHTTGIGPQNGGYIQAMGDLALVRRDGTHGRIEFVTYEVDTHGQIKPLQPEQWSPPGPQTTSYHHPTMYPLLDGRMYVRQADGIYCYDLRKNAGE